MRFQKEPDPGMPYAKPPAVPPCMKEPNNDIVMKKVEISYESCEDPEKVHDDTFHATVSPFRKEEFQGVVADVPCDDHVGMAPQGDEPRPADCKTVSNLSTVLCETPGGSQDSQPKPENFGGSVECTAMCSFIKQSDMQQSPIQTIVDLIHTFNEKKIPSRRVKFYQADSECGQWEEAGIGIMHLVPENSSFDNLHIQVVHAQHACTTSTSNILLDTKVLENDTYCLQNRRIITWINAGRPHCLSFVKQSSCSIFWSLLNIVASDRIGEEEEEEDEGVEEDNEEEDEEVEEDVVGDGGGEEAIETKVDKQGSVFAQGCTNSQNHLTASSCSDFVSPEEEEEEGEEEQEVTEKTKIPGTVNIDLIASDTESNLMYNHDQTKDLDTLRDSTFYSAQQTGGSFNLLKQYNDSLINSSRDSSGVDHSCSNRLFPQIPLPDSTEALSDCFSCLHILERNAASFPSEVSQALSTITDTRWLTTLWNLLDRAIEASDESLCSNIAEFLWRIVYICFHRANPFLSLAVTSDGERLFKSCDPLVRLLSDANYLHFFSAMEYETECRKHWMKVDHVDFLKKSCKFRQVICQSDKTFRTASHFIYRLIYLRDVCLPRHLDDQTLQRVNSIINSGYSYLCRVIQLTPDSIAELRNLIPEDLAAARFLHQLLCIFRSSTDISFSMDKYRIFGALRSERVIEAFEPYLTGNCNAVRLWRKDARLKYREQQVDAERIKTVISTDVEHRYRHHILSHGRPTILTPAELAVEILNLAVECRPGVVRSALLRQAEERGGEQPTFWYALCDVFHRTNNEGLQMQLSEIFKKLLDPVTMESPEKDDFLGLFYDKGVLDRLIHFLLTPTPLTLNDLIPYQYSANNKNCSSNFLSPYPYFLTGFTNHSLFDNESDESSSVNPNESENESDTYEDGDITKRLSEEVWNGPTSECRTPFNRKKRPKNGNQTDESDGLEAPQANLNTTETKTLSYHHKITQYLTGLSRIEQQQVLLASRIQLSCLKCRITEILAFCVLKHSSRIKYRNFRQNLHLHIIKMSHEPVFDPFLATCAVKFLRACLAAEPEHYARIFIRHNIFRSILCILKSSLSTNVPRSRCEGSLLESVVLEFFNFLSISVESSPAVTSLVKSLFEKYGQDFKVLAQFYRETCQFDLFHVLQAQYDEMQVRDKRSSKSDCLDSQQYVSGSYRPITTEQLRNRSIPQYSQYRIRPTNRLSLEEAEREIEDLYFQFDDDIPDTYSATCKTNNVQDDTSSALKQSSGLHRDQDLEYGRDILKNPHFTHDDDEDESDVPTFLKSSNNSSPPPLAPTSPVASTQPAKQNCVNLKIQLHPSSPLFENKD